MKYKYFLFGGLLVIAVSANAQKRSALFPDSTARKHELQLNIGVLAGIAFSDFNSPSYGFDLTYAKVFNGIHFIRTGIGFKGYSRGDNGYNYAPYFAIEDTGQIYNFHQAESSSSVWAKAGYEVALGHSKTRFLFGADIILGYSTSGRFMNYHLDSSFGEIKIHQLDNRGILVGINPRTTVRYNFSPLFSGGLTLGWLIMGDFTLYQREITDPNQDFSFKRKNFTNLIGGLKPEINIIFKIPIKKSGLKNT